MVDSAGFAKDEAAIGLLNIRNCRGEIWPANIAIIDNAIFRSRSASVSRFYDPVLMVWRAAPGTK
jgi:hypothetical protein